MERPGYPGKKTGQGEGVDLGEPGVHTHGIGRPIIIANGDQTAAIAGTQQVTNAKSNQDDDYQDRIVPKGIMLAARYRAGQPGDPRNRDGLTLIKKIHKIDGPLEDHLK